MSGRNLSPLETSSAQKSTLPSELFLAKQRQRFGLELSAAEELSLRNTRALWALATFSLISTFFQLQMLSLFLNNERRSQWVIAWLRLMLVLGKIA